MMTGELICFELPSRDENRVDGSQRGLEDARACDAVNSLSMI